MNTSIDVMNFTCKVCGSNEAMFYDLFDSRLNGIPLDLVCENPECKKKANVAQVTWAGRQLRRDEDLRYRLESGCRLCGRKNWGHGSISIEDIYFVKANPYDREEDVIRGPAIICDQCVGKVANKLGEKVIDKGARGATLKRLEKNAHREAHEFYLGMIVKEQKRTTEATKRADRAEGDLEKFRQQRRDRDARRRETRRKKEQERLEMRQGKARINKIKEFVGNEVGMKMLDPRQAKLMRLAVNEGATPAERERALEALENYKPRTGKEQLNGSSV